MIIESQLIILLSRFSNLVIDTFIKLFFPAHIRSLVPALSLGSTQNCTGTWAYFSFRKLTYCNALETIDKYPGKDTLEELADKDKFFKVSFWLPLELLV
jgi:hypothetical protein